MKERKYCLDNIRWITVALVIVYHVIYLFNSSGVISNVDVQGIPAMDAYLVFIYPWFMCLLFLVAGISSRYSLQKRTNKEFLKERAKRILIPSVVGIFLYGWISSVITAQYTDMFAGNGDLIPGILKYLIYCLMGIGPLWFCHVLFIACVLLVIIRKIDKQEKLSQWGKQTNYLALLILTVFVWLSALILNTPLITVYRFGIYLFMFFLGYYVFAHEEVLEKLKKIAIPMGIAAVVVGVVYVMQYLGTNYTDDSVLQSIFTNVYLWIMILAILGLGQKYLNFENKFTKFMTQYTFSFYVLHYTVIVVLGYLVVTCLNLPFILNYVLVLLGTTIILPLLVEVVKRIPIVNKLVLGTK